MTTKRVVIVGASRGIGKALVENFAKREEFEVIALSRNLEKMQADFGVLSSVKCFEFDLENNVKIQAEKIFSTIGKVDYLINNAGFLVNKPFEEITSQELQKSYQINLFGVFETVQGIIPFLNPSISHIVNISSMGGFQGSMKFAGLSAYSTSKAALCSFTELFAEEYKNSSIAMNCLCLGSVQTEMLEEAFPGYQAPLNPKEVSEYISDFTINAHKYMKGKIIPLSLTNP
jgi:NAD(P)-dependent dehydrogenase (short-subunit alcohol dehydrogenase family)